MTKARQSREGTDFKGIALLLLIGIVAYIIYAHFLALVLGSLLLVVIVIAGIIILDYYGGLAALASIMAAIASILASIIGTENSNKGRKNR